MMIAGLSPLLMNHSVMAAAPFRNPLMEYELQVRKKAYLFRLKNK